ncbi:unnamed protein product [Vicia faba]|uniref:Uncharacterized protein n=1 Tax=Vicia faba TaxID=3906 RepID=A0AAV1APQ3_VICFA|nr:unnamed protein product [Vicia faba]
MKGEIQSVDEKQSTRQWKNDGRNDDSAIVVPRDVDISNVREGKSTSKGTMVKRKKWTQRQGARKATTSQAKKVKIEIGNRQLVDVMNIDGTTKGCRSGENKLKDRAVGKITNDYEPEVVLEHQHRLQQ